MGEPSSKSKIPLIFWVAGAIVLLLSFFFVGVYLSGAGSSMLDELRPDKMLGSDSVDRVAQGETISPPGERINVLILGVDDQRFGPPRSDTMMLASFDPYTHEAAVLSLPRDTYVHIPSDQVDPNGLGNRKLNAAYVHGGPELAVKTVQQLLDVPVDHYVKVDFEGFRSIIDHLGGVDLCVEKRLYYEDPYQDLLIDIPAGCQTLDGRQALNYVRFRSDGQGDIGRIERQQKFAAAVLEQVFRAGTIPKLPSLVNTVRSAVDTDVSASTSLRLAKLGVDVRPSDIQFERLAGRPVSRGGLSYWQTDEEATGEQVDRLIRGIDREFNGKVRVRVLNGTSIQGAASSLAERLRHDGFEVVEIDNAGLSEPPSSSDILVHSDSVPIGKALSRSVRPVLREAEIHIGSPLEQWTKDQKVDGGRAAGVQAAEAQVVPSATIIIGLDYRVENVEVSQR